MNATLLISAFDALCAFAAAACAVYVAMRDSRWRKNGLAKRLEDGVRDALKMAEFWHDTPQANQMKDDIDRHDRELTEHRTKLTNVATKADIVRVEGLVRETEASAKAAAQGVDRIEGILIRNALTPHPHT